MTRCRSGCRCVAWRERCLCMVTVTIVHIPITSCAIFVSQRFKLYPSPDPTPSPRRLAPTDRASIIQYLRNKAELHSPSVYKLFFPSVIDPRTRRTDLVEREFYGNSRATQGQWSGGFSAVHFSSPLFGKNSLLNRTDNGGESEGISSDAENTRLRLVISAVNKLRPK